MASKEFLVHFGGDLLVLVDEDQRTSSTVRCENAKHHDLGGMLGNRVEFDAWVHEFDGQVGDVAVVVHWTTETVFCLNCDFCGFIFSPTILPLFVDNKICT